MSIFPRFRPGALVFAAWGLLTGAGLVALIAYSRTPGSPGAAARRWPAGTHLALDRARPTLVMLAHPRCPCTRASLGELARLLARCPGRLSVFVVFFHPRGSPAAWAGTDLWRQAAAIPGVRVVADEGGSEARAFGGETSGHVLLYDRDGGLRFSGGITDARGHEGDSFGRAAVLDRVLGHPAGRTESAVFGCSLREPTTA